MIEFNEDSKAKMRQIAEEIIGTCNQTLDDLIQKVFNDENLDYYDLPLELLRYFDDMALECQGCNWWVEAAEVNNDCLCTDCNEEGEEI